MTDDLKYIVTEINKLLGTEYNLISFDLGPEALLQLLVDVLHKLDASAKVNR
jgi:intraflagellar transport protein 81